MQTAIKPLKIIRKIEINVHGNFRTSKIIYNNEPAQTQPNPAEPDRNAFEQLISRKQHKMKYRKKIEEMHTLLNCDLSKFQNYLSFV